MLEEILERIAESLDRAVLAYMIIGGQAVLLYGEPRLTKDIDASLAAGLDRLPEVIATAAATGLAPLVDPDLFTRRTMVLPCSDPASGIRVDFILSFSPYEQLAISRAHMVRMRTIDVVPFSDVSSAVTVTSPLPWPGWPSPISNKAPGTCTGM